MINYNSFLLMVIGLWVLAAAVILQRSRGPRALVLLGAVTVVLAAGFLAVRPAPMAEQGGAEVQSQIGAGTPVLLEFRSPN